MDDLTLSRLLAIALLTPAQVVALGADLLADLEDRDNPGGSGLPRLSPEAVRVGRDGRARLMDTDDSSSANGAGLASVAALLDELRNAATRPSTAGTALIDVLERAATEARAPDGRLAVVAAILRAADATGGALARAELARLVAVVTGGVAPAPTTGEAARTPAPRRRRPRRRRSPRALARAAVARSWKWVLSLLVLIAVVVIEIAFLRDEIGQDIAAVLEAGGSGTTAASAPPTLPPVIPPAPAAAGTISGVDLRPVQPCSGGSPCALRLQVLVQPQAGPQTISWELRVLDRCTGAATTLPGGAVTVPPRGDRADAVSTIELPDAQALAVVAVTNLPFTAASPAVHVPEPGSCTT